MILFPRSPVAPVTTSRMLWESPILRGKSSGMGGLEVCLSSLIVKSYQAGRVLLALLGLDGNT